MDYPGILNLIGTTPPISGYLFETFIINLLQHSAKKKGKTINPASDQKFNFDTYFDATAPDGLDTMEGPTAIEIKLKATFSESLIQRELTKITDLPSFKDFKSFLFIFSGRLAKSNTPTNIITENARKNGIPLTIWDYDTIEKLVEENQSFVDDLVPNLSITHLKSVTHPQEPATTDNWKDRRERNVNKIKDHYKNNNLSMFLGAGVSLGAGVPTWNQLLNDLFAELITQKGSFPDSSDPKHRQEIVDRLVTLNATSPLVAGRYIRNGLAKDFVNIISRLLYKNVQSQDKPTDTLEAIARLCIPKRTGPGIRAVVTYNFDDLLEDRLRKIHVPYHPIFRTTDEHSRDELPIFHVHGFLPRNRDDYPGALESLLVFSEEGYHSLYRDPYFWSNFIQLTLLKDSSCLMVGLSLTDPNLRRLLEIAFSKDTAVRHYAILKRLSYEIFSKDKDKTVISAPRPLVESFLASHHQAEERLYQELGIDIVWVEDFNEIQDILKSIQAG